MMEENQGYIAVKSIIEALENQLSVIEEVHQNQDFSGKRREIEEHLERCIHGLEARRQILVDQLEHISTQQDISILKVKENVNDLLENYHELQRAGASMYKRNPPAAERIWKEAKSVDMPTIDRKDLEIVVSVNLPSSLFELISDYGVVGIQNTNKKTNPPNSKIPSGDEMIANLKAQIEILQKERSDLEAKLKGDINDEINNLQKSKNEGEIEEEANEVDGASKAQSLHDKNENLQDVNAKLQHMIRRFESELSEKSLLCESLRKQAEALAKKWKIAKEKSKAKLVSETSNLKEQIELLKKEHNTPREPETPELHILKYRSEKLKRIEKISDSKETEFQVLARAIGFETLPTISIFREMTDFGDHRDSSRHHDLVKLLYHQITYWHMLEFEDLPVLQTVIDRYHDLIGTHSHDLDILAHIFSGVSLFLYTLCKYKGSSLKSEITVEPVIVKQLVQKHTRSRSFNGFSSSRVIPHMHALSQSYKRESIKGVVDSLGILAPPCLKTATDNLGPPVFTKSVELFPLRSSEDFLAQLMGVVGKCFGSVLTIVAAHLDPLLDKAILVENFAEIQQNEPNIQAVNSFLNDILSAFQRNLVHLTLSQQFFYEVFSRINNYLMNGVILRQQFCTEAFGKHLMEKLEALQVNIEDMGEMWVGGTKCMQGIKEVAAVLQHPHKNFLVDERIRKATCPSLNSRQLRQLLSNFCPGDSGKRVPIATINAIGALMPFTEETTVIVDINAVHPFPIKILHYFEVEDMLDMVPNPQIKAFVANITSDKFSSKSDASEEVIIVVE
eukprot:Phypoly_transcript_03251.p1 GENE.Phypoly_transcript_03251~~Phypoly_transcript_03251.p1  ORF type:complete len:790 (+),score=120.28 Phypoly_transcript_03251:83-2452(+)